MIAFLCLNVFLISITIEVTEVVFFFAYFSPKLAECLFLVLEDTKLVSHQWWLFSDDFIFDVCTNEKNLVSLIVGRFTEIIFC